jgi:hypothetical protein
MLSDRLLGFLRELEHSLISYVILLPMAVGKQRKNPDSQRCTSLDFCTMLKGRSGSRLCKKMVLW